MLVWGETVQLLWRAGPQFPYKNLELSDCMTASCILHGPRSSSCKLLQRVFTDSLPPAGLMLLFCNTNVVKIILGFYAYFLFCTILNSVECLWMMLCTRPKVIRLCVYVMLHTACYIKTVRVVFQISFTIFPNLPFSPTSV